MAKKVRFRRHVRKSEDELLEILNRPLRDPEHKAMRAWLKREIFEYRRVRSDDPYVRWLEEQFGPIENAKNEWLVPCTEEDIIEQ